MLGIASSAKKDNLSPARLAGLILLLVFPLTACLGQSVSTAQLKTLYDNHQWFALRDATEHAKVPLFYRGATEAAFNEIKPAQKHLSALIKAAPHSSDAYEARQILATLYFRNGLYREAFLQISAMQLAKPKAEDVKNMLPFYKALSHANQIISSKKTSTIQMLKGEGNLYLPFTIDGKDASYAFDSGANFSLMSESEAKRLGLAVQDVSTDIAGSSGAQIGIRVAVAKEIVIGGLHLTNVAFAVLPDAQEPFVDLPENKRGVIGIPVLIAMQTFRWSPNGTFTFGFAARHKDLSLANLSFNQGFPVTQAFFQQKPLEFTLDTGAQKTVLGPPFAKEFFGLLKTSGRKESHKLTGVAGSSTYASVLLPSVRLQIGDEDVDLKPAHVLTKQSTDTSSWAAGNLGIDLLNEAHTITFDFHAMMLVLQ